MTLSSKDRQRGNMIITRTPFRVSFFGGGTDYPEWYRQNGGAVLSTAIDKYCYITCRYLPPFFPIRHRIVWSHIELAQSASEILHPAVRAALRMMGLNDEYGVEIHHQADLPARTGIGSSSSFAVGLIAALHALQGTSATRQDLYLGAIRLEREWLEDKVGSQDQVAAAIGGLNVIRFHKSGEISVAPVPIGASRRSALNSRLMMFFTGTSRVGTEIAAEVANSVNERRGALTRMHEMVDEAAQILCDGRDLDEFGRLLHDSWELKKSLSPRVSTPYIDSIYDTAIAHGALGGKLMGAGSSGFMLFYVPRRRQADVRQALDRFVEIPFQIAADGCTLLQNGHRRRPR